MSDNKNRSEQALARSSIYELLSVFFRQAPDTDFIRLMKQPDLSAKFADLDLRLDEDENKNKSAEEISDILSVDYTNLFIIPGKRIPLNESLATDISGSFLGKAAVEIKRKLDSLGITINESWHNLPDHISVEFELMGKLAKLENEHLQNNNLSDAQKCKNLQNEFLSSHLLKWIPSICDEITKKAETSFYRNLAKLAKDFMEQEKENIIKT